MKLFYISTIVILIAALTIIGGCSSPEEKEATNTISSNLIEISHKQFKAEGMRLGNSIMHPFTQIIETNGIITSPPQSSAYVHSYISGIVNSISVNLGSYVKKGQKLCTIQSREFISLQKEYLESISNLVAVKANYDRISKLYNEKISSQKDFYSTESEYKMLIIKIKSLKAELKILNVNIKNLENGQLSADLPILSPIEGYVTIQNCKIGQFVDSQKILMEVIGDKKLQIHFYVYQENVNKLKEGQLLNIYGSDNNNLKAKAKIISIGKSINPETSTIKCIAELDKNNDKLFIVGMYFQVDVIIDNQNAMALPSQAVIKTGNNHYVLIKEKEDANNLYFRKEVVNTGIKADGFTQIIGDKTLVDVLVVGTYYYQSE